MKIKNVDPVISFIVEIEEDSEYVIYKRNSSDDWDVLMGDSWECVFNKNKLELLENLYQEFIKDDDEFGWYNECYNH